MPTTDEFLNHTKACTEADVALGKNVWTMYASTVSELGEFADEALKEENVPTHGHKPVDEGTLGEGVDVVICALALYFMRGGTPQHLAEYGMKKLAKWEESQHKELQRQQKQ